MNIRDLLSINAKLPMPRQQIVANYDTIEYTVNLGCRAIVDVEYKKTTPHYFTLNEEAVRGYRTFAKVSPPLRSENDRQAIVEGISSGVIDAVVSDHSPRDQDSKRLPFSQASFGVVGLETLLPVTLEKVHEKSISVLDALAPLTCNPAKLLGLKEGRLQKKYPANFVLFDLDRPFVIYGDTFLSKCKNSPFNGKKVHASVLKTIRLSLIHI